MRAMRKPRPTLASRPSLPPSCPCSKGPNLGARGGGWWYSPKNYAGRCRAVTVVRARCGGGVLERTMTVCKVVHLLSVLVDGQLLPPSLPLSFSLPRFHSLSLPLSFSLLLSPSPSPSLSFSFSLSLILLRLWILCAPPSLPPSLRRQA
jgi:hypothetical protein